MLLAREGMNAEQLTRDLKSFELKPTFEDVFPIEAASVEEYLQQVHEMAMLSAVQGAQRDNLRSFDDYMLQLFTWIKQMTSVGAVQLCPALKYVAWACNKQTECTHACLDDSH